MAYIKPNIWTPTPLGYTPSMYWICDFFFYVYIFYLHNSFYLPSFNISMIWFCLYYLYLLCFVFSSSTHVHLCAMYTFTLQKSLVVCDYPVQWSIFKNDSYNIYKLVICSVLTHTQSRVIAVMVRDDKTHSVFYPNWYVPSGTFHGTEEEFGIRTWDKHREQLANAAAK